jgi:glycosyltransferase involved in cell wall biosynthesis
MKENAVIRALRKVEYFLYRKASRIVSVTHSFQEVLSRNGIDPGKIVVVPNGAEVDTYQPGPRSDELAERLGVRGKFVAAYVGTIGMAHGLRTLLDAADLLRHRTDVAFVLVGTGAEQKAMMAEANARGLSNVHFVGSVTKAEVRDYWRLCDVALVLLRDSELFRHVIPSKIFEAMSSQRPIILGVKGESEALLRRSEGGIPIPPEDAQALAAAITALADHETRRTEMGKAGRAFVAENYNRDVLAERMLDVLKEAAETPH